MHTVPGNNMPQRAAASFKWICLQQTPTARIIIH